MRIRNYRRIKAVGHEPGVTIRWLTSELDDAPTFAMKLFEIEPGASSAVYTHAWEDEVFVLRGQGTVIAREGEFPLREGDVIYIPPMENHQFISMGTEPLCLLMAVPIQERATLASLGA